MDALPAAARQIRSENPRQEGEGLKANWLRHGEYTSTAVVDIGPGGGMGPHIHHHHDEVIIVVEGEVDLRLAREVIRMTAGDVVSVGAGTVHAPVMSEAGCLLVSVFGGPFDPDDPDREFVDE